MLYLYQIKLALKIVENAESVVFDFFNIFSMSHPASSPSKAIHSQMICKKFFIFHKRPSKFRRRKNRLTLTVLLRSYSSGDTLPSTHRSKIAVVFLEILMRDEYLSLQFRDGVQKRSPRVEITGSSEDFLLCTSFATVYFSAEKS